MAGSVEENVLSALRGHLNGNTKLPTPRIIKVYIASTKEEFKEERRVLLEIVGPELQAIYDDRQIEVEIVDVHFGTGPCGSLVDVDPSFVDAHLTEVVTCHRVSKSVFCITLIGSTVGTQNLPHELDENLFQTIVRYSSGIDLDEFYLYNGHGKYLFKSDMRITSIDSRRIKIKHLCDKMMAAFDEILKCEVNNINLCNQIRILLKTSLEREIETALECSTVNMFSIFREWTDEVATENTLRLQQIKQMLTAQLAGNNLATLTIDGKNAPIDPELETHEEYLASFKATVMEKFRTAIDRSLVNDLDCVKGRKKTVQEIFYEHSTHLIFMAEHQASHSLITSSVPDKLRSNIVQTYRSATRHAPHFIYGEHGTGKSTLIAELYRCVPNWFHNTKVHRLIRFAAATPRSAYNLELLRVICQQISIIYNIPEGYLPKDASFDPIYINSWFQNLLRRCEDNQNEILFLFIDDLHKLNPLDCDIVTALSWLPISLPSNVYLICTTRMPIELLKLSPIQRERFKGVNTYFDIGQILHRPELKKLYTTACGGGGGGGGGINRVGTIVDETFSAFISRMFDNLEMRFGRQGVGRLSTYLTCTEYGLSETELLELLMPTQNGELFISTHDGKFNFATLRAIRNEMDPLVREKLMSGKILIEWRHDLCSEIAKERYMNADIIRDAHTEIANIFFTPEDSDISDNSPSEQSEQQQKQMANDADGVSARQNGMGLDVSYSTRHVEESWHHLMKSEDTAKLTEIAVCNFDFLLAAVQTVSISYLRCLIEHVRCYILDRDIELIYYTIRKSSDVLTRDPMQLGAQVISWLRPIAEHDDNDHSLLTTTVRSATAWCDGYTVPLLVPLTGWLPVPLPSQLRTMTVSGQGPIRCIEISPSKYHLIISPKIGDVQLWHIMNNSIVHTFKGHSSPVTCMIVPKMSQLLITGSEDTSVIVWNLRTREMMFRIREHFAPVTCVTTAMNNTLIISGGDDSSIIVSSLVNGKVLMKIDHHRGPVTAVQVSAASDVLVSASHDATVCLWSLENYMLLNSIQLISPIMDIQISSDSVFLLAHCEDNGLYLRTLATGTELHSLKGHKSKVRTIRLAMDSQRAIVGCDDTRALIFDMHSGKLVRSLPPNPGAVSAVYVMENDDFLITAGGNKITFYSFRNEDALTQFQPIKRTKLAKQLSTARRSLAKSNATPIACFDISRDSQLAAVANGRSINIWQLGTPEMQSTLDGHTGAITRVSFAPNGEFVASGGEDKTVIVWGLTLGVIVTTFKGHSTSISSLVVMMDSRRIISGDRDGLLVVWLADSATVLQTVQGPHKILAVTNNMKYAVCTNGDNSLRIWSLTREDEKYNVSHAAEITCLVITVDSLFVISGSKDMSLKVWQATGGKLAQVLVGHTNAVTCVAVSVTNKSQVISGSRDCNLILWDLHTGDEIHTLAGHLGPVTCVKVSADGTTAVSGSDDKTLIVWETKRGLALTSLQLHVPFIRFDISLECSRIMVQLVDTVNIPVICLHNTPASYVKLPTYSAPARDVEDLRPAGPKRPVRRLLKKEVSLDTYTWQKKYGHLTSSVMMAQVDERLKRRFSVSASMEEISKLAEMKIGNSQANLGPEQAALAQSQHFDQLEALWNKRSPPPRRRLTKPLSRQSSLVEDRLESSDEDEFAEERSDVVYE